MPNLLMVEGTDDKHVLWSLLKHYNVPQTFEVKEYEGVENLLKKFGVQLKANNIERLGIVVDADLDIAARWQGMVSLLGRVGYTNIPKDPDPSGMILKEAGKSIVGIWLMPNNQLNGMLEDFVSFLVRPDDLLWTIAQNCVAEAVQASRRFSEVHISKAQIHTWLAWQSQPGRPLGQAITTEYYLDPNAPQAQLLIEWLERLFVEAVPSEP